MRTNFVLIDFENVKSQNIGVLIGGPFKIRVFLGASQSKVPLEMASALQVFGPDAEYLQIDGTGNNALDFHIAYYIGRLAVQHPDAYFHVISKDSGFDPLISHLRRQKIHCRRSESVAEIPLVKIADAETLSEKVEAIARNLAKRGAAKPRTAATLRSTVKALFVDKLSDAEVAAVFEELLKLGFIEVSEGKISYHLPGPAD